MLMPTNETPAPLIRLTDANYADGVESVASDVDPVAISAGMFDQDGDMPNEAGLSNMFVAWGQFTDHDLSLSLENHGEVLTADGLVAPLGRSDFIIGEDGARVPTNAITWQLDGSQVYGSTPERTADLRSFEGGRLRTADDPNSDQGLMPNADTDSFMAGDIASDDPVFLAGDIRANENPALASMHTVMVREHNYWADRIAAENPDWTDDQVFEAARSIVVYEMQAITYNEWLPHLVGDAVGEDTGFDPDVNGQVSVEFSTAAFRFGHTMVSSTLPRLNADGTDTEDGDLAIMNAFFNDDPLKDGQLDAILRGQMGSTAQGFDTKVVDDLNFFLESPDGLSGFSLVALNILRGQDHGLQSYVDTRAALIGDIDPDTLDPHDFSIINSDPAVQAELAAQFDTVHDVDLWVGGLSEAPIEGTQMGPTFTFIVVDQFTRTRAGDENFGTLDPGLSDAIVADVKASSLSDVLIRTTGVDYVADDPFLVADLTLTDVENVDGTQGHDILDLPGLHVAGDVKTGLGDDDITLRGGTVVDGDVQLNAGDDTFVQSSGKVLGKITTGVGHDTVTIKGDAVADGIIHTGSGDDQITVTDQATVGLINAGRGDDTVTVTSNATTGSILLAQGDDTVTITRGATVGKIDGGEDDDGRDTDILQVKGGPYRVEYNEDDTESGQVVYLNEDGTDSDDKLGFRNIEMVTCFTPGTFIGTPSGDTLIEDLNVADTVITRDHGAQAIRWIGQTQVAAKGALAPVLIKAGVLGNTQDLIVSQQHRMMLSGAICQMVCGCSDLLVAAKHLVNGDTIQIIEGGDVTYIHMAFDSHEIVTAAGIPSESFHPGEMGLGALGKATRDELLTLFPMLAHDAASYGPPARPSARAHEAKLIAQNI